MLQTIAAHRIFLLIILLGLAFATVGGTCVVAEEGVPGAYADPGENEEVMLEQEQEAME
jgi:hypothetical protein